MLLPYFMAVFRNALLKFIQAVISVKHQGCSQLAHEPLDCYLFLISLQLSFHLYLQCGPFCLTLCSHLKQRTVNVKKCKCIEASLH